MLFQSLIKPDRTKTQTAYAAQYMPFKDLSREAEELIVWRKFTYLYKGQIEAAVNEEKTILTTFHKGVRKEFNIVWVYNAIPTELEWDKKSSSFIISVDFRVVKGIGQLAQLSFY